jgi:hypothetical protein
MDDAFVKKLLRYAKHYLQLGMHPVPVLIEAKKSILLGWPDLRLKQEDLVQYFWRRSKQSGDFARHRWSRRR